MKQPEISCLVRLQGVCLEVIGGYINSNEDFDVEKAIIIDFLHDSVEDTDTTYEEIKENFGEDIALGVLSLTKNDTLPKKVKMIDSLNRIKQQNKEVCYC